MAGGVRSDGRAGICVGSGVGSRFPPSLFTGCRAKEFQALMAERVRAEVLGPGIGILPDNRIDRADSCPGPFIF